MENENIEDYVLSKYMQINDLIDVINNEKLTFDELEYHLTELNNIFDAPFILFCDKDTLLEIKSNIKKISSKIFF